MATRSYIAIINENGLADGIYSHWDGYLEGVGATLVGHYSDPVKIRALIDEGDVSILKENIGTKHDFSANPDDECTFYHRDRGEELCITKRVGRSELPDIANHCGAEFLYLFDGAKGGWQVYDGSTQSYLCLQSAITAELAK